MNPKESSEVTVETLLALRRQPDALRLITEKLRVKKMGPADHIRTKHEVKTFVETGDATVAAELIRHARERAAVQQSAAIRMSQTRSQNQNL